MKSTILGLQGCIRDSVLQRSRTGRESANTFRGFEWMAMVALETQPRRHIRDPVPERAKEVSSCSPSVLFVLFTPPAEVVWDLRTGMCSRLFDSPANAFSACSLHQNGVSNTPLLSLIEKCLFGRFGSSGWAIMITLVHRHLLALIWQEMASYPDLSILNVGTLYSEGECMCHYLIVL
jgi:hypothetical protein